MSGQATGQVGAGEVHPVRAARKAMSPPLTVEGLAFKAGVSAKTIERIERGHVPHRATARVVADVLKADPAELFPTAEEAA